MPSTEGGTPSGFRGHLLSKDPTNYSGGLRFFQIKGTESFNTKAVQIYPKASNLNSNDAFLLQTEETNFIWEGKGANELEKDFAEEAADRISPTGDLVIMQEGFEVDEFWKLLGGKSDYASSPRLQEKKASFLPRLFQCSNSSGKLKVDEILDFDQEDLCEDDVMILDTNDEVFVWIGKGANDMEKKESLNRAMEYIQGDRSGRTINNTVILQVKQGHEPLNFKSYFYGWDPNKWNGRFLTTTDLPEVGKVMICKVILLARPGNSDMTSYENLRTQTEDENRKISVFGEELEQHNRSYTYDQLKRRPCPFDVDISSKEKYLSEDEFKRVFGITRKEFECKPKWKQIKMKKEMGLF